MPLLSRESILTADDLKTVDVPVPEWGGEVRIRSLTGTQRELFGRSLLGADGKPTGEGYNLKLVAVSVVQEDGTLAFTLDDVQILGTKSDVALERVVDAIETLNKMKIGDIEAAKGN